MIRVDVSEVGLSVVGRIDGVDLPGQTMAAWCEHLIKLGADPASLITMRWAGKGHDSWVPSPLADWAPEAVSCLRGPGRVAKLGTGSWVLDVFKPLPEAEAALLREYGLR